MQETPAIFDATPFARYQETPLPGVARPGSHAVWWQRAFRAADDIFMDTATWLTGNQPSLLVLMFHGLYRNKARHIHAAMTRLERDFAGRVPRTMDELLTLTIEEGASDLHVTAGVPPTLRIHGSLNAIDSMPAAANFCFAFAPATR